MEKPKKIAIIVDDKKLLCDEEENVLQCALRHGVEIPHFCYHEDLPIDAACRTCLVEILPGQKVVTSCDLMVKPGLKVSTKSKAVEILRRENMELMLASHRKLCHNCRRGLFCKTWELMKKHKVTGEKYERAMIAAPVHKLGTAAELDPQACINCNKCVEMCQRLGINFLKLTGKGAQSHITYNEDPCVDCVYCGQCTVHCPVAAAHEQSHIEPVEEVLKHKKGRILIAQMAPSVRASIGEEFGLKPGSNLEGQMVTALKKLGFDYVFDVNMGADITTIVEATELVERIRHNERLPMFTSCCPGWVKYVEFYHPELIPNLTEARSPQIHSGAAYKTWWAKKMKIDPRKVVVVSLMPCTSKKYEAHNKDLRVDGLMPVDFVLTTRETGNLLKKHKINLPKLKPSKLDLEGTYSGAAAIYGASGGVMESALRSAVFFLTGKELAKVEFEQVRGMKGIKKADIKIGDKTIRVAVVFMAKNAQKVIDEIKKNPGAYHYVEVMTCPGGCIGGGGQPIPSTEKIIWERIQALYRIDDHSKLRKAHLNPVVQDFFENYVKRLPQKKQDELLLRYYKPKKKFE
jgi:iron-only hydrogenase group A